MESSVAREVSSSSKTRPRLAAGNDGNDSRRFVKCIDFAQGPSVAAVGRGTLRYVLFVFAQAFSVVARASSVVEHASSEAAAGRGRPWSPAVALYLVDCRRLQYLSYFLRYGRTLLFRVKQSRFT